LTFDFLYFEQRYATSLPEISSKKASIWSSSQLHSGGTPQAPVLVHDQLHLFPLHGIGWLDLVEDFFGKGIIVLLFFPGRRTVRPVSPCFRTV